MGARLVVVGVPGDKRLLALSRAMSRRGLDAPILVPWRDAVRDPRALASAGHEGDWLRIESPGSDLDVWRDLVTLGGGSACASQNEWRPRRAWMAGLTSAVGAIERAGSQLRSTQRTSDLLAMTDKLATARLLGAHGVATPKTFEAPGDVEALRARLDAEGSHAVFVKSRWGSSGSGVFALRRDAGRERLVTTTRLEGGRAFNDKRVSTHDDLRAIEALLAPVLADGAIVQRWIPKAGVAEGPFDLRVVVSHGRVAHRVARVGRSTITNLHLDAQRLAVSDALAAFGPRAWSRVESLCRGVIRAFDPAATIGLDVAIDPAGMPWVIECNAWGDYLPGLLHEGQDTYELQLSALFGPRGGSRAEMERST